MILEENDAYIHITLSEKDRKRGIIDLLEESIPTFDCVRSSDNLEWHVAVRYRQRLNSIIHKLNGAAQLSLFQG